MSFFLRFRRIILLGIAVIFLVGIVSLSQGERDRFLGIENAAGEVFSPALKLFNKINNKVVDAIGFVANIGKLEKENEELRREVSRLTQEKLSLLELKAENERLRQLLDVRENIGYETITGAEVIGYDPGNWSKYVIIDKGSSRGVQVDATVITELGLVGKVVSVTPHSAKVLLITDPDSAVGGRVQRSRDVGIVEGSIEQANMVQMVNIPREADIKEGDLIISSGLGGVFPAGLIIGKVENIKDEEYSFFRRASIKPAVNFNRLEEVLVIKQRPNVDYSTENRGL